MNVLGKGGRRVARKVVRNYVIDTELAEELERLSAAQGESMSVIVRAALRSHIQSAKIGAVTNG